jgi:glycosyltransferase involved in cell wall biosynthesis
MERYPKLSIITPSYNQARYLERTIRSVLDQEYPALEYIIIDGGSTDGSVDIIKKHAQRLAYWVSEADAGQAAAINKGLRRATGDWVAWQNSDDIYYPGTFHGFARAVQNNPDADLIIGDMLLIDMEDRPLRSIHYVRPSYNALRAEGMVLANQASFWRRPLHEQLGWLDEMLHCSFDYEWFLRLTRGRKAAHVKEIWGGFRLHDSAKTHQVTATFQAENREILGEQAPSVWFTRIYQLRRLLMLLAQGDFAYVVRGLRRRYRLPA